MSESSFDDATSFDSRWKNDGLGWHGRHENADVEPTEQSVLEVVTAKLRFYVGNYATCGNVCAVASGSESDFR